MSGLDIVQDYDCDDDGELGGPINVFWAEGHGHTANEIVRAVIDHCLDEGIEIPRIPMDFATAEMWQRNITSQGSVIYDRTPARPAGGGAYPITVLDLESPRRCGGRKCGVENCTLPWSTGAPVQVRVEPGDRMPYMVVRMWFCRDHARQLPGPAYRVCLVPVGATILLPDAGGVE